MRYSGNSVVPASTNVKPWVPFPVQAQNQPINYQMQNSNSSSVTTRRILLTAFGGLLAFVLLGVVVAAPILTAVNAVSDGTTTTSSTTMLYNTTSTTTTTATTSTTTSTSSTSTTSTTTTTTVTIGTLQWNATGRTVAGVVTMTSATATYLNLPIGIWLDSSDTLFVADASNNRIQRFAQGNTSGTTVCGNRNGVAGSNSSLLTYPNDITIDSSGNMYVVDTNNHRVQLWRANATEGVTIAGTGTAGNSTSQLNTPRHIVFGANQNTYYISDAGNHRVLQFTINSTVGTLVAGGNGAGKNITQLNNPRGMYFDSVTNSLIIANPGAHNVVRWVIGASSWTIVAGSASGAPGNSSTTLYSPWDVILDPVGNIYVADRYNHRIQFYQVNQTNVTTIVGTSTISGTAAIRFNEPISVALDSQLNLYVADAQNERIQKFFRF